MSKLLKKTEKQLRKWGFAGSGKVLALSIGDSTLVYCLDTNYLEIAHMDETIYNITFEQLRTEVQKLYGSNLKVIKYFQPKDEVIILNLRLDTVRRSIKVYLAYYGMSKDTLDSMTESDRIDWLEVNVIDKLDLPTWEIQAIEKI